MVSACFACCQQADVSQTCALRNRHAVARVSLLQSGGSEGVAKIRLAETVWSIASIRRSSCRWGSDTSHKIAEYPCAREQNAAKSALFWRLDVCSDCSIPEHWVDSAAGIRHHLPIRSVSFVWPCPGPCSCCRSFYSESVGLLGLYLRVRSKASLKHLLP